MDTLRIGVFGSALWAALAVSGMIWRARAYGRRIYFARQAASPARGVLYAFTAGMAPGAKESVKLHLPTYAAGMTYHAGIFAALAFLAALLAQLSLPSPLLWAFRAALALGTSAGLFLLAKRVTTPHLRGISCPDDYASNVLVTAFAATSALCSWGAVPEKIVFASALVFFVYVPFGKIRHCAFFFMTRICFGIFYGRRGALPPPASEAHG
jgi:nitrate reductase gamma subunit